MSSLVTYDRTCCAAAITVPVTEDLVPQCISHRDEKSLGTATSTSPAPTLSCRTLQSAPSGPNENDAVSLTCGSGEVLTGCSSYQPVRSSCYPHKDS